MSTEKVPQILIVDVEAGEVQKVRRDTRAYKLSHVIGVSILTFLFTAFTTLCMIPSTRHTMVTQQIPFTQTSVHDIVKRAAGLETRGNLPKNILFPLYIDPGVNGTNWNPIYKAAKSYPGVTFTIVINPNNGPDTGSDGPDPNYNAGLAKLSSYDNIQVLGYVHQSYGARSYNDVMADVATWATWGNDNMYGNAISGIFFDEGPADDGDVQVGAQKINTATKQMSGFADVAFIVQNPGILPTAAYFEDAQNCDVTIVLENTYAGYQQVAKSYNGASAKLGTDNSAFAFIFGAMNKTTVASIKSAITPMLKQVNYLYITNQSGDNLYSLFGTNWLNFVKALSQL